MITNKVSYFPNPDFPGIFSRMATLFSRSSLESVPNARLTALEKLSG